MRANVSVEKVNVPDKELPRFLTPDDPHHLESKQLVEDFAEKAHRSLDIRNVLVTTVQGCILLGTLCYADGNGATEAVYYATAARLAIILDLPRRKCGTELERQVNLRGMYNSAHRARPLR
jgi:hypothetical protein